MWGLPREPYNSPSPPRIKPGSGYSDEMVIDVALSKYCDLVPVERYTSIAGREGLKDLPSNSLIQQTHYLSDFVEPVYDLLGQEILRPLVLRADETPHRMLEGGGDKSHYLWGFQRSGQVILKSTILAVGMWLQRC